MAVGDDGFIHFGPEANCTLELCQVEDSVYGYRPSIPANVLFIIFYSLAAIVHVYLGIRWRTRWFMWCVLVTCLHEVVGYVGRIMLYNDPWDFTAFMINIIAITQAPVFYCAAIYVTLAQSINHFSPDLARFPPRLLYWTFIPCDITSLVLQGTGGGMTADSSAENEAGLRITRAGLILQIVTLFIFLALFGDFLWRYKQRGGMKKAVRREKLFFGFVMLASVLTFARCIYRVAELKDGYRGELFRDEPLFIVLEGVLVVLSVFALCIGHPGLVFRSHERSRMDGMTVQSSGESQTSRPDPVEPKSEV